MLRLRDQILYTLLRLTRKSRIMNVITLITSTIKDYYYYYLRTPQANDTIEIHEVNNVIIRKPVTIEIQVVNNCQKRPWYV